MRCPLIGCLHENVEDDGGVGVGVATYDSGHRRIEQLGCVDDAPPTCVFNKVNYFVLCLSAHAPAVVSAGLVFARSSTAEELCTACVVVSPQLPYQWVASLQCLMWSTIPHGTHL